MFWDGLVFGAAGLYPIFSYANGGNFSRNEDIIIKGTGGIGYCYFCNISQIEKDENVSC